MQRKVASRRKKWTAAERFANKQKNILRLAINSNEAEKKAQQLLKDAEQEIAAEQAAPQTEEHVHGENCNHG